MVRIGTKLVVFFVMSEKDILYTTDRITLMNSENKILVLRFYDILWFHEVFEARTLPLILKLIITVKCHSETHYESQSMNHGL